MPEIVEIGPLMIRGNMLAVILACVAGFVFMHLRMKRSAPELAIFTDFALNAGLIVFACWKLGPLLYEPDILWTAPWKLIALPGTGDGALFGMILGGVYLLGRLRKKSIPIAAAIDLLALFAVGAAVVYAALSTWMGYATSFPWAIGKEATGEGYHPVHLYAALVFAIGAIRLWQFPATLGTGSYGRFALLLIGLGGLCLSLLMPQQTWLLYLSAWQLICICMVLVAVGARLGGKAEAHTNA